ncbi:MAG TPA: DUF4835 family protein [Ignavibacteriaceae bacterium]|nr:DUF4835 family protein [Ignavibacteriaceae bacterium]
MKLLLLVLSLCSSFLIGQELNCKVSVNLEGIPVVNRDLLRDFGNVIEDYMNKSRFLDETWEGDKIDCSLSISIIDASSEVNYTAQVVVQSQRPVYKSDKNSLMLKILDDSWSFIYERGQALIPNQTVFDPVTSFLDYYANIIIGFDKDSFEKLAGSPCFNKAFDIVNLGAVSRFSSGWENKGTTFSFSRRKLVEDLLNDKFHSFREAFFEYHYNGIDLIGEDHKVGQKKIVDLITLLDSMRNKGDLNSVLIKVFFDAKNGEIAEYLKDYPDKGIFKILMKLDPPHASKYQNAMSEG